tara:strand:- start:35328 stop:35819 length:492 start_codon:yes stop_codon:yes gene_type:complete
MSKSLKYLIVTCLLFASLLSYSQKGIVNIDMVKADTCLFKSFNLFYKDYIKKMAKSKSGAYNYNKVSEIKSVNYIDYDADSINDVLVEFVYRSTKKNPLKIKNAVLFKRVIDGYKYIAHLNQGESNFEKYLRSKFYFLGEFRGFSEDVVVDEFVLKSNKFVRQ